MRLEQVGVLVEHQRAGVGLEDLGGHADRVERLVEVTKGLMPARSGSSGHPDTTPRGDASPRLPIAAGVSTWRSVLWSPRDAVAGEGVRPSPRFRVLNGWI